MISIVLAAGLGLVQASPRAYAASDITNLPGTTPVTSGFAPNDHAGRPLTKIMDNVFGTPGAVNYSFAYDTYSTGTPFEAYVGYTFSEPHGFEALTFQEGMHYPNGGWFNSTPNVQILSNGTWITVGAQWATPYLGGSGANHAIYELALPGTPTGTGIRIQGVPGGSATFITVAELRVTGGAPGATPTPAATATPTSTATSAATATSTPTSPLAAPAGMVDVTAQGTVFAKKQPSAAEETALPNADGGGRSLSKLSDGVMPAAGSIAYFDAYDTFNTGLNDSVAFGYTFAQPMSLTGLGFQEGMEYPNGGTGAGIKVRVRSGGWWRDTAPWIPATSVWSPAYPGANGTHHEAFKITFPPVVADAIEVRIEFGGFWQFATIAELRAYASSAAPATATPTSTASPTATGTPVVGTDITSQGTLTGTRLGSSGDVGPLMNPDAWGAPLSRVNDNVMPAEGASVSESFITAGFPFGNSDQQVYFTYTFATQRQFTSVLLQEGVSIPDNSQQGGWLNAPEIEVWQNGAWVEPQLALAWPQPCAQGTGYTSCSILRDQRNNYQFWSPDFGLPSTTDTGRTYRVHTLTFLQPITGSIIRLRVNPTGQANWVSIAEFRVFGTGPISTPTPTATATPTATPTATVPAGLVDVTSLGTLIAVTTRGTNQSEYPLPTIDGGGRSLNLIRDNTAPAPGTIAYFDGYDTWGTGDNYSVRFGYTFSTPLALSRIEFTEGMEFPNGGTASFVRVHVRQAGTWRQVLSNGATGSPLPFSPPYTGANGSHFDTYSQTFTPLVADAIRLELILPSPSHAFVTIAELRVYASTESPLSGSPTPTPTPTATPAVESDITNGGAAFVGSTSHPASFATDSQGRSLALMSDGSAPDAGDVNFVASFDTFTHSLPGLQTWFGYTYASTQTFRGLQFTEGMSYSLGGGWFSNAPTVQVRIGGVWTDIATSIAPAYVGNDNESFTTYELTIAPTAGDGIRLIGNVGGLYGFASVAELRVINTTAAAVPPTPLPTDITAAGSRFGGTTSQPTLALNDLGGRPLSLVNDGVMEPAGAVAFFSAYDTLHHGPPDTEAWLGYTYVSQRTFTSLLFQEGMEFPDGGWFAGTPLVQVRVGGVWVTISTTWDVTYAGANGQSFERFTLTLASPTLGDGIRILGTPGGSASFVSVGELRVFGLP